VYLQEAAQIYNRRFGLPPIVEGVYVSVDEMQASLIAEAYEKLPANDLGNSHVWEAYCQFAIEVRCQFLYAREIGIVVEPWVGLGEPYQTSSEMCWDVLANNHLYFFTGGEPHPFLGAFDLGVGVSMNEQFRVVHDLFGHAAYGFGFGPRGEESSWLVQSQMFSPLAQKALTTETRGQSSWFNYGPYVGNVLDRPFARQKAALLPDVFTKWHDELDRSLAQMMVAG